MNRLNGPTLESMDDDRDAADEAYDRGPGLPPLSQLASDLFNDLNRANEAALQHIKIGRQQFAREVSGIIGTASAHKDFGAVVGELMILCAKEGE